MPVRHMWTASSSQGLAVIWSDRLRSYVRPVVALAHERWPRWFPRQEFLTNERPTMAMTDIRRDGEVEVDLDAIVQGRQVGHGSEVDLVADEIGQRLCAAAKGVFR